LAKIPRHVHQVEAAAGAGREPGPAEAFELGFLDPDGIQQRLPLAAATDVRFEDCRPVRSFPAFKGQRNSPGLWWAATMGRHVGFESWLERDHAMLLDFDPCVVGFAPQPFWLFWQDSARARSHAPDWFARLDDGSGVVVDCRPANRIRLRDQAAFAATEQACTQAGWGYRLVDAPDPVFLWRRGCWRCSPRPAAAGRCGQRG
jgi:hypothetical protein